MAKKGSSELIKRAEKVNGELKKMYPEAICALEYKEEGWKLLVMARLSAQCTDKRVNEVSEKLFARFPSPEALATGDISEIEEIVKPCGLYRMKARDIKAECEMLTGKFGGVLPDDIDTLLTFPGVGRKIANLLVSDVYGKPGFVADTHCIRISGRLGFVNNKSKDAYKVEMALRDIIDENEGADFCHRIVMFGRDICSARNPKCQECPISSYCPEFASLSNQAVK